MRTTILLVAACVLAIGVPLLLGRRKERPKTGWGGLLTGLTVVILGMPLIVGALYLADGHRRGVETKTVLDWSDPEDGYTIACDSVISELKSTGKLDGEDQLQLASMTAESIATWNHRLKAAFCRPSVSISVVETKYYDGPILFGAAPVTPMYFRQWREKHPHPKYVNSNTGNPILNPLPTTADAENLISAQTRLNQLKEGKPWTQSELSELIFVDDLELKKGLLLERKQHDLECMELSILIDARNAGVPIGNLSEWASGRVEERRAINARWEKEHPDYEKELDKKAKEVQEKRKQRKKKNQ